MLTFLAEELNSLSRKIEQRCVIQEERDLILLIPSLEETTERLPRAPTNKAFFKYCKVGTNFFSASSEQDLKYFE